ncbi:hypothetical protein JVX98_13430 [Ensifer sp. PDNC004]|uniref:hypothetical protein n=1 Tax=Ensifer sp. PDNC004 TaxID=2811423 RepID=UPI001962F6D8|nr:hypothetical protein [Ensifer sp. PDNC004]QRY69217.1 hypothetical protein JVX98_13430 [Ensifer sp. PDNC004]
MTDNEIDIDALAQEIRRVDGNHSLGHGALAEALAPFIAALSRPIDPKAEVEPVAELVSGSVLDNGTQLYEIRVLNREACRDGLKLFASPSIVAPVGVKPLEWMPEATDDDGYSSTIAKTPFWFQYDVWRLKEGCAWKAAGLPTIDGEAPTFGSRDEAIAAVNGNYADRVLELTAPALTPAEKAGVGDGDVVAASCIARMAADDMIKQNIQWRLDPRYILRLCDAVDAALTPAVGDELIERINEVFGWRKTGVLTGEALRSRATEIRDRYGNVFDMADALSMAEKETAEEAMRLVLSNALSTTKPAQGGGEWEFEAIRAAYERGAMWRHECGTLELVEKASYDFADKMTSPAALAAQGDDAQEGTR